MAGFFLTPAPYRIQKNAPEAFLYSLQVNRWPENGSWNCFLLQKKEGLYDAG
jgi:hypothetical protein